MRAIDHNAMHACKGAILKNTQNSLRWQQCCTWSRVRVSSSLYVELVVFLAVYRRTRHVLKCQREVIGRMISQNLKKTSVPLGCEPTIQNIKEACKRHFDVADGIYCDVLAGERGPSWSETSQISNWKVIQGLEGGS